MLNHIVLMGRLTRDPELRRVIAVDSERKGCDRDAAAGPAQLGVTGKTTHENDLVQHE